MTYAPLNPGTAPRTSSRLFSASTDTTRRFRVVTRSWPYRPGSFLPFFGRPLPRLLASEAVEPTPRRTFLAPRAPGQPPNPPRITTPDVPPPLGVPITSPALPPLNRTPPTLWPPPR